MDSDKDQRICIKFCIDNEITENQVCEMIKTAFEDESFTKKKIISTYNNYKNGSASVDDEDYSEKMATINYMNKVLKVRHIIKCQENMTVKKIIEKANVSWDECNQILIHLMKKDPLEFI